MKTINRLASFIKADHRYVYLGTSVIAALGLAFSQRNPTPLSFLAPTGIFQDCLWAILWAWLVVSAAALVTKLMHWNDYRETSPFASERFRRGARLAAMSWLPSRRSFSWTAASCRLSTGTGEHRLGLQPQRLFVEPGLHDLQERGLLYPRYRDHHRACHLRHCHRILPGVALCVPAYSDLRSRGQRPGALLKSIGRGFATIYSTIVRGTP